MPDRYDAIIIGGGIAGASMAYFLSEKGMTNLLILEKEEQPGYHSTGRSAAVLVEIDPIFSILQLKVQAADFLRKPPPGFSEHPLLVPTGILALFEEPAWDPILQFLPTLDEFGVAVEVLSPKEVISKVPVIKPGCFDGGLFLFEDGQMDVHQLLWSYLGHAKRQGTTLRCGVEVTGIIVEKGRCCGVLTPDGPLEAEWVINAAGAWVGVVGEMAGALPIKFSPLRRTIISFPVPKGINPEGWPLVVNYTNPLYFSPEAGGLFASSMDEDPCEPCDAQPDELVVARIIDRMGKQVPDLVPQTLRRKWSGLRTFAPDQEFVVGEDPEVRGFFWLAGQGGAGIETSPAVGRIAADLIIDGKTDHFDANILSPQRFMDTSN